MYSPSAGETALGLELRLRVDFEFRALLLNVPALAPRDILRRAAPSQLEYRVNGHAMANPVRRQSLVVGELPSGEDQPELLHRRALGVSDV